MVAIQHLGAILLAVLVNLLIVAVCLAAQPRTK